MLLVLVILAALGVIALQNYLVYDDHGVAHLTLPWQQETPEDSGVGDISEPLNITVEERHEPQTELRAVQLPQTEYTGWDMDRLTSCWSESSPFSALAVTVKDGSGRVYYDSEAAKTVTGRRSPAETMETLKTVTENTGERHAIARLSCLRDPIAAKADVEGMGLKNTGGYIFYDGNNTNWLDPSKEGTAAYLSALARECAAMGFDEILLTDVSYPTEGKLDKIDYGTAGTRPEVLCALVRAVADAVAADYPEVQISVELPAQVITTGRDDAAGLVLADMAGCVDRVYAVTTESEAPMLAQAVAAAGEDAPGFVPELAVDLPPWEMETALPASLTDYLLMEQ